MTTKTVLACLLLAAAPAWSQGTAPPTKNTAATKNAVPPKDMVAPKPLACANCGTVSSIQAKVKQARSPQSESAPSGFVASVPLGSGGGKAQVGPSQKFGKEAVESDTTFDVVVRLDDGRFRLFSLEERGDWREGDRVKIEDGRLLRP